MKSVVRIDDVNERLLAEIAEMRAQVDRAHTNTRRMKERINDTLQRAKDIH